MSIERLLTEEVQEEIVQLGKIALGTDEYEKTVNGITKQVELVNEAKKIELEKQRLENENKKLVIEEERIKIDKKDRNWRNAIAGGSLGLTGIGMVWMFLFEEKGSIVSQTGRKVLDRIFKQK